MKKQLNTDRNIEGNSRLENYVNETLVDKLSRFSNHITRLEVHLSDQNGDKSGSDDHHCKIEARLEGFNPLIVLEKSSNMNLAINGAADKMKSVLEKQLRKN